jgi:hypothetical protein
MLYTGSDLNLQVIEKLMKSVNFTKDIPDYIFYSHDYYFWFFERPILDYMDLLEDLAITNDQAFESKLTVCFGRPDHSSFAYFLMENTENSDLFDLKTGQRDFFGGTVGYPITLMNSNLDWIGFESAYEELGIIAVNKLISKDSKFIRFLDENFITPQYMESLRSSDIGKLVRMLLENYCQPA